MSDRNDKLRLVYSFFDWLNSFSGTDREMTLDGIKRFFREGATMTFNGRLVCTGWEGQLGHGRDLQAKMKSWNFRTPFELSVVEGDRVVGYYICEFVAKDGTPARAYDLCVWTLKDGKIDAILENVVFEGSEVDVATIE